MENSQQELDGKGSHRSFDFNSNEDDELPFVNFPSQILLIVFFRFLFLFHSDLV